MASGAGSAIATRQLVKSAVIATIGNPNTAPSVKALLTSPMARFRSPVSGKRSPQVARQFAPITAPPRPQRIRPRNIQPNSGAIAEMIVPTANMLHSRRNQKRREYRSIQGATTIPIRPAQAAVNVASCPAAASLTPNSSAIWTIRGLKQCHVERTGEASRGKQEEQ